MNSKQYERYQKELESLEVNNSFRELKAMGTKKGKFVNFKNKKYLNLSSNDYLGLAADKELLQKFFAMINDENMMDSYSLGSTSSRLLTGNHSPYDQLETEIAAAFYKISDKERAALVFNSGYHANIGIIPALTKRHDLILSDMLNHASIIDGLKLSNAEFIRYRHLDYQHLEKILIKKRKDYNNIIIVSESVFSMDGDIANLKELVKIKNRFNTMLYIDEAHAVGVYGKNGLGISELENLTDEIDIIVGTFGKALASQGAYAICDPLLRDYLINKMRSLIFTTSLPPINVNWNLEIFRKLPSLQDKREHLLQTAAKLRKSFEKYGLKTDGSSQIVPLIIGDNEKTVKIAGLLQEKGLLVFPIRPPTVPQGSSRLRFSLTADIDWDDIKNIAQIVAENL